MPSLAPVDQLAVHIRIRARRRWAHRPLGDGAAIDIEGFRRRVGCSERGRHSRSLAAFKLCPLARGSDWAIISGSSTIDAVISLGAQAGHGPVGTAPARRYGACPEELAGLHSTTNLLWTHAAVTTRRFRTDHGRCTLQHLRAHREFLRRPSWLLRRRHCRKSDGRVLPKGFRARRRNSVVVDLIDCGADRVRRSASCRNRSGFRVKASPER